MLDAIVLWSEMNRRVTTLVEPKSLPALGATFAALFCVADAVIDVYAFEEEHTFLESLLSPEPVELWMRCLVVIVLVLFAFYAKKLLTVQKNISEELNRHKYQLEQLVDERTNELAKTNIALQEEIRKRKKAEVELERLATTDPLTLLFNRRKFDELLEYEMERDRRYRSGLSILFCDIDNFKRINDKYGHDVGDSILSTFASKVKNSIRKSDIVARWGGEEFVLLIPNTTAEITRTITEKIRKMIESTDFPIVGKVTASFGVTHSLGEDNRDTVIKRADESLYRAKEKGRNRVEVLL
jgi:diguanylate cyclase (GGDEF)-like protein